MKTHTIIRTFVLAVVCIGSAAFADKTPQGEFALTLGEETFDPRLQVIVSPTEWEVATKVGNDLRLVQFDGPIQEEWVDAMLEFGVVPVQYIHPYTYITWAEPENRDAVQSLPHVRWSGDFLNGYRVLPKWRNLSARPIDTKVMVYKGVALDEVLGQLRDAGATRIDHNSLDTRFEIVSFVAPGTSYLEISTIPGVFTVQPKPTDGGLRSEMSNQVNVGNVDAGGMAFPGYDAWLNMAAGVDGSGVTIAIVDGGTDGTHPDLVDTLTSCAGQSCAGGQVSYHGTHTGATIAATGASGETDANGFLQGQGVAPGASLVSQLYSPTYQQAGGMTLLMTESYRNGAVASSIVGDHQGRRRGTTLTRSKLTLACGTQNQTS